MGVRKQVRIKRVYDDAAESDGTRVLVHRIWPRGVSKAGPLTLLYGARDEVHNDAAALLGYLDARQER